MHTQWVPVGRVTHLGCFLKIEIGQEELEVSKLRRFSFHICAFVALTLAVLPPARAQNVGSLQGTVTDPSGASVSGATATLTDLASNATRTAKTDSLGSFSFAQLNPGTYRLSVSQEGFKTYVAESVTVLVATPTHLDIHLDLGAVNQQVLVESAAAPVLNTQDATVGNPFEEKQVTDLPFLARNVVNLLTLQPGVVFTGQSDTDRLAMGSIMTLDPREGAVDGVRGNETNVTIDGVDANDWQNQAAFTSALPVTLDSVQEFRVTTTNANATSGMVGGPQVQMVTKSGSDDFHGNVRWYYRTPGPTANTFFNNANSIDRPQDVRNIAGGSLGGPIKKDRVFFFLDNEERREAIGIPVTPRQVPTDALRDGVLVYDCSGNPGCPTSPTTVAGLTSLHSIPANAFGLTPADIKSIDPAGLGVNPAMVPYMTQFPHGNAPTVGFDDGLAFTGFVFDAPEATASNIYTARFDFNLTKDGHHTIFWKGAMQGLRTDLVEEQYPGQAPAAQLVNGSRGFALQYQAQLRPTLTNTLRWGLTRLSVSQSGTTGPEFDVRSFTDILNFDDRPLGRAVPVHNINDDVSWVHGKHTFQFGGGVFFVRNHSFNATLSYPEFFVNNGFCTNLCEDAVPDGTGAFPAANSPTAFTRALMMLTGSITQVNATYYATKQGIVQPQGTLDRRIYDENDFQLYGQDTWQLRSNLTVTLGLNYMYETPPWEANGNQVAPTTDIMQWFLQRARNMNLGIPSDASPLLEWTLAGKANGKPSWFQGDGKDFGPRVAFAYSPNVSERFGKMLFGDSGKSVLRAGAGIFYDRVGQPIALDSDSAGSPGIATPLIDGSQQFSLATAPRFAGTCTSAGCTGLPNAAAPFFTPPTSISYPYTPVPNTSNLGFFVDPHLRTPYTMHFTTSFQRQLSKSMVLDVAYVGTMGRRLLGKADFAQYLDIRDPKSGEDLWGAFRQITALADVTPLNGTPAINPKDIAALSSIKPIPFFNNMLPDMPAFAAAFFSDPGYSSLTPTQAFYAYSVRDAAPSWSCALFPMDTFIGPGLPSPWNTTVDPQRDGFVLFQKQFSSLPGWTNWANSNYNSLQVSLRKTTGFGLFTFNYVYSKSIDNDSSAENGDLLNPTVSNGTLQGLIQNPFDLRANRAVSDFNLKHNFNGNWVINLPFGQGRRWFSNSSRAVNAAIGGWEFTGAARWRSGFPIGPGNGFNFPTNFFLTSNGTLTAPLKSSLSRTVQIPGSSPAVSGPNLFKNPSAALAAVDFTAPGLPGSRNSIVGPAYASTDLGVYKDFHLFGSERQILELRATAFNVFNSVNFASLAGTGFITLDPTSPSTFGQITSLAAPSNKGAREMEFAVRYDF